MTVMCSALEVSVSGFYAWRKREPSQHSREDAELADKITTAFQCNRGVYGSPRVHAELKIRGSSVLASGWHASCTSWSW